MNWYHWYFIRHFMKNSLWICPVLAILAALWFARLIHTASGDVPPPNVAYNPESARALLGALASSMFTFIVFVSSALLVAVQLASAQLTPRIIATVFNDPVTKIASTVFTFAFTFTLAVLNRVETSVPPLMARLAAYSCLVSLGTFLPY
jgi:uncharacterized membrane protein